MFEKERNLTDFYSEEAQDSTRGVLLYQNMSHLVLDRIARGEMDIETPVKKSCARFPLYLVAPLKPTDPLYVFSRWSVVLRSKCVSELANSLLEAIDVMFGAKCRVRVNLDKAKISVDIPSDLCIKIKFFALPEDPNLFYVMFRKDSGDGFAFSSFFKSCIKYLEL